MAMHDINRMGLEASWGTDQEGEYESGFSDYEGEYSDEFEFSGYETEMESIFDEAEEMELAAELLEIQDEAELDLFIGNLIKRASGKIRKAIRSPIGRTLGGALRGVAKKFLPVAGAAVGNMLLPGVGGIAGSNLASMAGKAFGLELEGLSPEDQEFEVARRFVRLAGQASANAAAAPPGTSPAVAVKSAIQQSAQKHAPGLVGGQARQDNRRNRGTWIRRGGNIVILGV